MDESFTPIFVFRIPSIERHLRVLTGSLLWALASPNLDCHAEATDVAIPNAAQVAAEEALAKEFTEGMAAFQKGDYAAAAGKFEGIVAKAGEGAQLESVYFTLGASYFNLGQYDKALESLRAYQSKYPKGARIADVTFSIGQACLLTKDFEGAAAQFARLESVPAMRERALVCGAKALKDGGRANEAIAKLEALVAPGIKSPTIMEGAMLLAGLYGGKADAEKSRALIENILRNMDQVENLIQINAMAVELGDSHLESGRPADALGVYRLVRRREEVVRFQEARVAVAQKKLDEALAAIRADPKGAEALLGSLPELRDDLARAGALFEESKKLPDFTPAFDLRLGRCYYDLGRRWESLVAYGDILGRFPAAKERETALFASVVDYAELNRAEQARRTGEMYLKEFPAGEHANTIGYLMGVTALQANDPETAVTYFGRMLKEQPASTFTEEMRFLLGNAKFAQGQFAEATKDYEKYRVDYPKGAHAEEAAYRIAVSLVFAGQYEKAIPALEKYLADFPAGPFAPDARYRLAVCLYAANQYDDVVERCRDWEKTYGNDQQLGEVLALLADSLMARGETDEAIATYIRSYKTAATEEVLGYSLFEAQKAMQKKRDWTGMSAMFEEFVNERPVHPLVPMAMFWIGKAKAREGRVDEAKTFLADTIKKYIGDPKQAAVEQLLTQLAQLCARKKPAAESASPQAAPAPDADPAAELETLLGGADAATPTARARKIYAQAELARIRRQPAEQAKHLDAIARDFQPADLSPALLAQAGDHLLAANDLKGAEKFYQALMDTYPRSDVADFACFGLGEIAYRRQEYPKALDLFNDALDKGVAAQKVKDLTVGRAKTLLALGRLDEAQKGFEQVASVREWRGDSTAFAVYSLGEIEFKRGKWSEANAFFQRVFVAYQKFLPWVAKSYIGSGECFEKLGKAPEAVRTYQELLRNEKLARFAETAAARKRIEALQGGKG